MFQPLEIIREEEDDSRNLDRRRLERSWLLRPTETKKKRYLSRKIFLWTLGTMVVSAILAGVITLIVKSVPHHKHKQPQEENYTIALHKALLFFNAQRSGKLPEWNNVSWRGDSGLEDGKGSFGKFYTDLIGGYYDGGDAVKSTFPMSYAMTMLSWSVIEYRAQYEAVNELEHVKEIIKWGSDYLLKTYLSDSIGKVYKVVSQVGEHSDCWIRPEDVNTRLVSSCPLNCSALAAETGAALASASIVFKDDVLYSEKLVDVAKTLHKFAEAVEGSYTRRKQESSGELIWSSCWLYYATGNTTYLEKATNPDLAKKAGVFSNSVFSYSNKLPGAQLLLTRFRMFLNPGYPFETVLSLFHNDTDRRMCSFLPYFNTFNRTKGGLIMLNHPKPLQYVANAAFLATLYGDYLAVVQAPGWTCGSQFYPTKVLRLFASSQIDYILGKNPRNMSYLVGFGQRYPRQVHHRGASIPTTVKNESCEGRWKWRDSKRENPNTIVGAMVAGPDEKDGFQDVRENYTYTEATLAGNAGLVAALVALSEGGGRTFGVDPIDRNSMFVTLPPLFPATPPPPTPWVP